MAFEFHGCFRKGRTCLIALTLASFSSTPVRSYDCPPMPVITRSIPDCVPPPAAVARPVRLLATVCPPAELESDRCKGQFPVRAGSGGAAVKGFFKAIPDPASRSIRVRWKCPQNSLKVVIDLDIDGKTFGREVQCSAESVEFTAEELKGWVAKVAYPAVTLHIGDSLVPPCILPVHLLAEVTVPAAMLPPHVPCQKPEGPACLIMYSNFAATRQWLIATTAGAVMKGQGRMGRKTLLISPPADCKPVSVFVDFDRTDETSQSIIAEVRF
jgi:hypothetical protein